MTLGKKAKSGNELLNKLFSKPVLSVNQAKKTLGLGTHQTANALIRDFQRLQPIDIFKLAKKEITTIHMFGRGDIQVVCVHREHLKLKTSVFGHPLHVNITNWPIEEHTQLLVATKLALNAHFYPDPHW